MIHRPWTCAVFRRCERLCSSALCNLDAARVCERHWLLSNWVRFPFFIVIVLRWSVGVFQSNHRARVMFLSFSLFSFLSFFLTFFKAVSFSTLGSRGRLSNCSHCNNHLLCLNTTFRQLCSSRTPSLDPYLHRQEIHCLLSLAASPPGFGRRWELITSGDTFLSLMEQVLLCLMFWKTTEQFCKTIDGACYVFVFFSFKVGWGNNTGLVVLQASITAHKSFQILLGVSALTALGGELLDEDKLYI